MEYTARYMNALPPRTNVPMSVSPVPWQGAAAAAAAQPEPQQPRTRTRTTHRLFCDFRNLTRFHYVPAAQRVAPQVYSGDGALPGR